MSAPRRWIEEGGSATPFERDLLRSALSVEPPPQAQKQVWAAVLAQLPPLPPGGGPGDGGAGAGTAGKATAAGKAATAAKLGTAAAGKTAALIKGGAGLAAGAGLLKSALIGAGSAVALLATYSAATMGGPQGAPQPPPAAMGASPAVTMGGPQRSPAVMMGGPQRSPQPPPAAMEASPAATMGGPQPPSIPASGESSGPNVDRRALSEPRPSAAPLAPAPAEPSPSAGGAGPASPAAERETMLREEAAQVGEARDALRRGDAVGALTRLEQIRSRFPSGVLTQEREALTIEALARSGHRDAAATRAAAFLQAYPTSVLAERVHAFAPAPQPAAP